MPVHSNSIGAPVLRLDLSGQGESVWDQTSPGQPGRSNTIGQIVTLGVTELASPEQAVAGQQWVFQRTERPAQGRLSRGQTRGVMITFLDAKHPDDPEAVAALRDWADFDHIPQIVAANVPGLTMITPYEVIGSGPRYLHLYEFDHDDPDQGQRDLAVLLKERLDPDQLRTFASHPERERAFAGCFRRRR